MPLEIKELHIRVTVNQPRTAGESPSETNASASQDQDGIIRQCIEQVMDMIRAKNER
ncbi:MAG: DUF5908 family protein [Mangrovibacterium sp.]|nr:DUF5908 family protein [Mangrovibacterium sp.]